MGQKCCIKRIRDDFVRLTEITSNGNTEWFGPSSITFGNNQVEFALTAVFLDNDSVGPTLTLTLSEPTSGTVGSPNSATVIIYGDDDHDNERRGKVIITSKPCTKVDTTLTGCLSKAGHSIPGIRFTGQSSSEIDTTFIRQL